MKLRDMQLFFRYRLGAQWKGTASAVPPKPANIGDWPLGSKLRPHRTQPVT